MVRIIVNLWMVTSYCILNSRAMWYEAMWYKIHYKQHSIYSFDPVRGGLVSAFIQSVNW